MNLRPRSLSIAAAHLLGLALIAGCGDDSGGGEGGTGGSTSAEGTGGGSGSGGGSGDGGGSGSGGSGSAQSTSGNTGNASSGNATATSSTGDAASSSSTGGGDAEPPGMEGMTAAHNAARASVDPPANPAIPPLSWDPAIAAGAQAYAENCVFDHSGNEYGENIFASAGQPSPGPQDVVDSWTEEAADYDYANNSCSGTCGHYTQVVWADSLNLGCGHAACTTNSPFDGFDEWDIWVCNYDPPGNYVGESPY